MPLKYWEYQSKQMKIVILGLPNIQGDSFRLFETDMLISKLRQVIIECFHGYN